MPFLRCVALLVAMASAQPLRAQPLFDSATSAVIDPATEQAMRGTVPAYTSTGAAALTPQQRETIAAAFAIPAEELTRFRWSPSMAPQHYPDAGSVVYTVWLGQNQYILRLGRDRFARIEVQIPQPPQPVISTPKQRKAIAPAPAEAFAKSTLTGARYGLIAGFVLGAVFDMAIGDDFLCLDSPGCSENASLLVPSILLGTATGAGLGALIGLAAWIPEDTATDHTSSTRVGLRLTMPLP